MTSRDFCYWLQGWFELNKTIDHREGATPATLNVIMHHLAMVFKYEIDPSFGDKLVQEELHKLHDPTYYSGAEKPLTGGDFKLNC